MAGVVLEVCCYNLESALNAQQSGADRIELCADRHQGGTTPSYGMQEVVKNMLQIPVFVMIRPRGGDFLYSGEEIKVMMHDIQMAKELGMDGVVLGVLSKEGQVNKSVVKDLAGLARPLPVTFHRAFDLTPDPIESLHTLMELGIDRLLTSGQHHTAYHGRNTIKTLVETAGDKMRVMPGAGINEENVVEILSTTGAREFHVSASGVRPSGMKFQKSDVLMGDDVSEYTVDIADGTRIGRFRELVEQYSAAM